MTDEREYKPVCVWRGSSPGGDEWWNPSEDRHVTVSRHCRAIMMKWKHQKNDFSGE